MCLKPKHRPPAAAMSCKQSGPIAAKLFFNFRNQFLCEGITPGAIVFAVGIHAMTQRTIAVKDDPDTGCGVKRRTCIPASGEHMIITAIAEYPVQYRKFSIRLFIVFSGKKHSCVDCCRSAVKCGKQSRLRLLFPCMFLFL